MPPRQQLIACARAFLGVRFVHQGRNRQGLDCLGLLIASAAAAGIRLQGQCPMAFDERQYSLRPDTELLQLKLAGCLQQVNDPRVGDVVLFSILGRPQHLALVSDYPAANALGIIHAYAPARQVVEHRFDDGWHKRLVQVYRLAD